MKQTGVAVVSEQLLSSFCQNPSLREFFPFSPQEPVYLMTCISISPSITPKETQWLSWIRRRWVLLPLSGQLSLTSLQTWKKCCPGPSENEKEGAFALSSQESWAFSFSKFLFTEQLYLICFQNIYFFIILSSFLIFSTFSVSKTRNDFISTPT